MPTSESPRPLAQTISVADGRREAILIRTPGSESARLQLVDCCAGGGLVGEPGRIDRGVVGPFGWQRLLGEDRVDRAFRLARAAVDALVRIDEELSIRALVEMDAIDRTDGHARDVEHVDAWLGDHIRHSGPSSTLTDLALGGVLGSVPSGALRRPARYPPSARGSASLVPSDPGCGNRPARRRSAIRPGPSRRGRRVRRTSPRSADR